MPTEQEGFRDRLIQELKENFGPHEENEKTFGNFKYQYLGEQLGTSPRDYEENFNQFLNNPNDWQINDIERIKNNLEGLVQRKVAFDTFYELLQKIFGERNENSRFGEQEYTQKHIVKKLNTSTSNLSYLLQPITQGTFRCSVDTYNSFITQLGFISETIEAQVETLQQQLDRKLEEQHQVKAQLDNLAKTNESNRRKFIAAIISIIPVSLASRWLGRISTPQPQKDQNIYKIWYNAQGDEPEFKKTFPFLFDTKAPFFKSIEVIIPKGNTTQSYTPNLRRINPDTTKKFTGNDIYTIKETSFNLDEAFVLQNRAINIDLEKDIPREALNFLTTPFKPIYEPSSIFNKRFTQIQKHKSSTPDATVINRLFGIEDDTIIIKLVYLGWYVNDEEQYMMRYPAYQPFSGNRMKKYRFQNRPWWKYLQERIDKSENYILTKPYEDTSKSMPPTRTLLKWIPNNAGEAEKIIKFIGIDFIMND